MGFKSDKPRGKCPVCNISLQLRNGKIPTHYVGKGRDRSKDVACPGEGKNPK